MYEQLEFIRSDTTFHIPDSPLFLVLFIPREWVPPHRITYFACFYYVCLEKTLLRHTHSFLLKKRPSRYPVTYKAGTGPAPWNRAFVSMVSPVRSCPGCAV